MLTVLPLAHYPIRADMYKCRGSEVQLFMMIYTSAGGSQTVKDNIESFFSVSNMITTFNKYSYEFLCESACVRACVRVCGEQVGKLLYTQALSDAFSGSETFSSKP